LNHHASPEFWQSYRSLPVPIQRLADRCYAQLKRDPRHPSLRFKKVGLLDRLAFGIRQADWLIAGEKWGLSPFK
jgi:hypothetical protein